MSQLYSLRSTDVPDEFLIKKFDDDFNCVAEYVVSKSTCSGPDGHRPKCKHREMLRIIVGARQVNTGSFFDWDTRRFQQPLINQGPQTDDLVLDNTIPSEPPILGLPADEQLARKLAPAHESAGSALVKVEEISSVEPLYGNDVHQGAMAAIKADQAEADEYHRSRLTAAAPSHAAVKPPAEASEQQRTASPGAPTRKFVVLRGKGK